MSLAAALLALPLVLTLPPAPSAGKPAPLPALADAVKGLDELKGFVPLYWDGRKGRLLLEIDRWDAEFLYVTWLATGVGSNDVGLDRGQPGDTRVVVFRRSGPRVLLVHVNYAFRAESDNAEERRAAREAFAESVLWGFDVEAEGPGGAALVDATKFFLRDARDVPGVLTQAHQGAYKLDASRCALFLPRTKNFLKNTEVEATLTFTTAEAPGPFLQQVVPSPRAVTVREHHSFIELPGPGYRPRAFDPRCGYFDVMHLDFAVPLGEPLERRRINRHRLQKQDARAASSPPVKPIIYYVDRGAPEPVRSALLEGARWWDQAFEAAGYQGAFRVELLPEDADPMDARFNVIQWVHRATRGWAYGSAIVDPRTGEIVKGHVTMDSQRARQVYKLLEGLAGDYEEGKPPPREIERAVLARLRQLSAHEVGHTLGLAHNFAASVRGRASVMDYPAPLVKLGSGGSLDLSQAYAEGIGAWDKVAIAYGYQDFAQGADEGKELSAILARAAAGGHVFITDQDARPDPGAAAHPLAHLWDNGSNAVDELDRILAVRARALERFSERNLRAGRPWSDLEERLTLVYFWPRYQAEAVAKLLGGLDYTYALRGDGQKVTAPVPAAEQRRALDALLRTMHPDALAVPERILRLLPPKAFGQDVTREVMAKRTAPVFDALGAAECAAGLTVRLLLDPARAARLVEQHARDGQDPSLAEVIDRLLDASWKAPRAADYRGAVRRAADAAVLYYLMALAANDKAAAQARAVAYAKLMALRDWLAQHPGQDEAQKAHALFGMARIDRFQKEPAQPSVGKPPDPPPGQPIGGTGCGG